MFDQLYAHIAKAISKEYGVAFSDVLKVCQHVSSTSQVVMCEKAPKTTTASTVTRVETCTWVTEKGGKCKKPKEDESTYCSHHLKKSLSKQCSYVSQKGDRNQCPRNARQDSEYCTTHWKKFEEKSSGQPTSSGGEHSHTEQSASGGEHSHTEQSDEDTTHQEVQDKPKVQPLIQSEPENVDDIEKEIMEPSPKKPAKKLKKGKVPVKKH